MKKVAINTCFGGFELSDEAELLYLQKKYPGKTIDVQGECEGFKEYFIDGEQVFTSFWDEGTREDPILIEIIESMGKKADGHYSELKVVEIPEDISYTIEDYDGCESIHEAHRSWA